MLKTLRISFALRNTYRVNAILYAIKQIPLVKRGLPDTLYRIEGFKIFAYVLSIIWEIFTAFATKALYLLLMLFLPGMLYNVQNSGALFLHMLVFLTMIGGLMNTVMFDPTKDKYYALITLNMDAKAYTAVNYFYAMLKYFVGFAAFGLLFGLLSGVAWWQCLLIPLFVVGIKMLFAALSLLHYEKSGKTKNENRMGALSWIAILLLLGAAYGLPLAGLILPSWVSVSLMCVSAVGGVLSVRKIFSFGSYREIYRDLLLNAPDSKKNAVDVTREQTRGTISADTGITSQRRGFEYLNELFIKRHKKILWKSAKTVALVVLVLLAAALLAIMLFPQIRETANRLIFVSLPWLLFVMYAINRGTGFTRALFINCDHSLLTYSFYKQPKFILKLFQIRLREIVKINLLPAAVIGTGLAVCLYASGGTDNPLNYAVLLMSIPAMSVFFSVHYLTIYYLLQPYNAGTEIKSGMYQVIMMLTYMVCYFLMQIELTVLQLGIACILFCLLYCLVACILVYKLAPKTFKIRT